MILIVAAADQQKMRGRPKQTRFAYSLLDYAPMQRQVEGFYALTRSPLIRPSV